MEKEFVPHEQALALKELGFDENCFGYYIGGDWDQDEYDMALQFEIDLSKGNYLLDDKKCTAPTFSQTFRWFREKYNIQATIEPTKDQHRFELGFNYWIWNTKTAEEWFTESRDRPAGDYVFDTYEEAELECLKKLIEITKVK